MNSSGIKRGLATTAVSALAIAGLPLIASSASAAPGDSPITVAFAGPALNAGDEGAVVILEVPTGTVASVNDLKLTSTGGTVAGSQNNGDQDVAIDYAQSTIRTEGADPQEFGAADGNDEVVLRVLTTTSTTGATANFRVFNDNGADADDLEAGEARVAVNVSTAGPVADIVVTPPSQTVPENVRSGAYTVTLKDAAGRTTQVTEADAILIDDDGADVYDADNAITTSLSSDQVARGVTTITAQAAAVDVYNIDLESDLIPTANGRATLDVTAAAVLTEDEINIVTGADDWFSPTDNNGFGTETYLSPTENQVVFNIDSDDPNSTATLTFTSTDVTFGGQTSVTKSVVLDSNGNGSITLDVDPASIQDGDEIDVTGSFALQLEYFLSGAQDIVPAAQAYVAAPRSATTVTATVVDYYGNALGGGEVGADVTSGPNTTAAFPDQRKPVAADGTVSFTFTDAAAIAGQADVVDFYFYPNQFTANGNPSFTGDDTEIRYTADGQGSDFTTRLESITASGAGYNPALNVAAPLTDAVVDNNVDNFGAANEAIDLDVVNAEPSTAINVSVDNGALILAPGETLLSQGAGSIDAVVNGGGSLPAGYQVVGTKAGLVTVTVTNAGRTETSQFNVQQVTDASGTARNVALTGPSAAVAGDVVTFLATVTDAFGNPVAGVTRGSLNVVVSGPGSFQDGSAVSDANGQISLNVRIAESADSPVTVSVTATGAQFGAAANQREVGSAANSGPGLAASASTASATIDEVTDIEGLEQAVEEAEADLAAAEADLAAAVADRDVALAQLAVAQSEVDRLKERKAELRKKLNKAKANGNRQKAKTTRKKLRNVKRQLNDAKTALVVAQTRVDGEQNVVDLRQAQVTAAEEALAEAQADLDEAQN